MVEEIQGRSPLVIHGIAGHWRYFSFNTAAFDLVLSKDTPADVDDGESDAGGIRCTPCSFLIAVTGYKSGTVSSGTGHGQKSLAESFVATRARPFTVSYFVFGELRRELRTRSIS
jgi:hypothetical protein